MALLRMPLLDGAYQARTVLKSSQRSVNLFPLKVADQQATTPVFHFPTPGLTTLGTPPLTAPSRISYRASNGALFAVLGPNVYSIDTLYQYTQIGSIPDRQTVVSMADNGLAVLLVDGSSIGYAIDLTAPPTPAAFATINDPSFAGGTRADYIDTFFVTNIPGSDEWQASLSFVTFANMTRGVINPGNIYAAWDPLDFGIKSGSADPIVSIICMNRNVWIIGALTTEIWYNAGASDFAFSVVPGAFVEHGCIAPYSLATTDLSVFWLAQNRSGKAIVLRGTSDYKVGAISTRGIEDIISDFPTISDAIGGCFQIKGQAFYVLTFPTANRTFAVELRTEQWHELAWTDSNGMLNRSRMQTFCFANGVNLAGDWQTGALYQIDPENFTDAGNPITRIRTVPHVMNGGKQVRLDRVIADLQGGTLTSEEDPDNLQVFLGVSLDKGATYGQKIPQQFGAAGQYGNMPQWRNLGMSRDFVLELSWSTPINTVLKELFLEYTESET